MPIFLVLVFGVIQYGLYFWSMQAGTAAVGEAVRRMTVGDCQTDAQVQTLHGEPTRLCIHHDGPVRHHRRRWTYTKADGIDVDSGSRARSAGPSR